MTKGTDCPFRPDRTNVTFLCFVQRYANAEGDKTAVSDKNVGRDSGALKSGVVGTISADVDLR